jgi:hypothetical protein
MADKRKVYKLKIIWSEDLGVTHLSEEFSDLDKIRFEVNGELLDVPEEMQREVDKINSDILGLS